MTQGKTEEFREYYRTKVIPSYYNGFGHVIFNAGLLLSSSIYSLYLIESLSFVWIVSLAFLMLIIGNLVVFLVHKYPLHKRLAFIPYAYKAHTIWHHAFFTHQKETFQNSRDLHVVFFPPVVVASFCLFLILPLHFILPQIMDPNKAYFIIFMTSLYFILYEIVHFASHLPEGHWALKLPHFAKMRKHHLHHHNPALMSKYNFNIVFPLFDKIFGADYREEVEVKQR